MKPFKSPLSIRFFFVLNVLTFSVSDVAAAILWVYGVYGVDIVSDFCSFSIFETNVYFNYVLQIMTSWKPLQFHSISSKFVIFFSFFVSKFGQNKTKVMFIPLLCWGIPLSIWIDAIFVVISQDITLSIGNFYRLDDIFVYTLTGEWEILNLLRLQVMPSCVHSLWFHFQSHIF